MPPQIAVGTTPFRDAPYKQMDGSDFESTNCVFASCTELVGRVTVGALRVPAPVLREISGNTRGAATYGEAEDAVVTATHGRVILRSRYGLDRNQVRDMAASGRGFCISLDCSVTLGTKRATGTYKGNHTVYVGDYKWRTGGVCRCELELSKDHAEFLVDDPGVRAPYRWWSATLLYRAAEKRGGGSINTLAGADTEAVIRTAPESRGQIRTKADTGSVSLGPIKAEKRFRVISTENGLAWKRPDDTLAFGWHRVELQKDDGSVGVGFIAGMRLR